MKRKLIIYLFVTLVAIGIVTLAWYRYDQSQQQAREAALVVLEEGIELAREKRNEEALSVFEGISIDVLPDWRLPYYRGSMRILLKDYEGAAPDLEESLLLKPDETKAMFALGVTYFKLGKLDLAKAYFGQVLEFDPSNEEAKGLMDIMAQLQRNTEAARQQDGS